MTGTTGAGASTYTNDANGNTLTGGGRTNVWDSQNRLVSCTKSGVASTYTYGADGLRRSSTVNGVTTYYVYDGQTMVQEAQRNAQGQLQATTTYLCGPRGPECRIDEVHQDEGYYQFGYYTDSVYGKWVNPNLDPQTGQYVPPQARGRTSWYVFDGLGSVVGEVDPNGNMTASAKYDVYGAKRSGGTGTASSRQGFVGSLGHVTDTETGLIYMRARYYDPNVGRFVSEDPSFDGNNWFSYCDNSPVNIVDTNGRKPWPVFSQNAWAIGMELATFAAAVAICTSPQNKAASFVATSLAGSAVVAFSYASLGLLSPDMNEVLTNLKTYMFVIATMVGGMQIAGKSALPGAAVATTAAFVYGMAVVGALVACDYDIEH